MLDEAVGRASAAPERAAPALGRRTLLALAAGVFAVHALSPSVQVTDSRLSVYAAHQLIHDGSLDLSTLPPEARAEFDATDYDVVEADGQLLPFFPYAPMVLLVPAVGLAELVGVDVPALELRGPNQTWWIELPMAALVVALTTVVVALAAFELALGDPGRRRRTALTAALFFAFGTAAWSTASRAFWQQTPAMLAVAVAALFLIRAARAGAEPDAGAAPGPHPRPGGAEVDGATTGATSPFSLAGAGLACAYVCRPTSAVAAGVLGLWVLVTHPRQVAGFATGAVVVLVPFVAVNGALYDGMLPPYFEPERLGSAPLLPFAETLAGNAISPSRGLLVFTPLFLLIPHSLRRPSRPWARSLLWSFATITGLQWLVLGVYGSTGGAAYGARLFTEITPLLVLLLVPLLGAWTAPCELGAGLRRAVTVLGALSVVIAGIGGVARSGFCWSANPEFVDFAPERIWDVGDPQALRPVRDLLDGRPVREVVAGSCVAPTA